MNKYTEIILEELARGIIIASFLFLALSMYYNEEDLIFESSKIKTSCATDSMGLVIDCKNKVEIEPYKNETLKEGSIYIYRSEINSSKTIIHRLVYCLDSSCNWSIFKGDNNDRGEMVQKSQILYKVKGIEYD